MPILTKKDAWNGMRTVFFVGPDRSGEFRLEPEPHKQTVPQSLDPLLDDQIVALLKNEAHDGLQISDETVTLDYSEVSPCRMEQVLRVTGLTFYRNEFYLNHDGYGQVLSKRPKPQPTEHRFDLYSFTAIREPGVYRRRKDVVKDDETGVEKSVYVGWETHEEYYMRHPERRPNRGSKER